MIDSGEVLTLYTNMCVEITATATEYFCPVHIPPAPSFHTIYQLISCSVALHGERGRGGVIQYSDTEGPGRELMYILISVLFIDI